MDKKFNFEEWKKKKIERGDWLPEKEYKRRMKRKREAEDQEEAKALKSHRILYEEYTQKCAPINDILEDLEDNDDHEKTKKVRALINREMVLDTETTGLSNQDKIVEISILELIDGIKTGRKFHTFFNPEIKITKKAVEIHNITNEKVKDQPLFASRAEEIIKFIGESVIIAHNAKFDQRMLNNELKRAGWEPFPDCRFIDTLEISRFLYPKEKNNQDALCRRFEIDNYNREKTGLHSAYEDTVLLYFVYQNLKSELEKRKLNPYDFKIKHSNSIEEED
jgi:DNA polymerase-3 subunit epsilon